MPKKRQKPAAQPPRRAAMSAVLTPLRVLRGMLQTELARKAGVRRSAISEYEGEGDEPRPEVIERVAAALGVSLRIVAALADLFAALASLLDRLGSSRVNSLAEEIVAGALRCAVLFVRAIDKLFVPPPTEAVPAVNDRHAAVGLWQRLETLELPVAQAVIQEGTEFHSAALVELLCKKSIEAAADDADRAVELADLARLTAEQLALQALRARALGFAWGHLGNGRRVQGSLPEADQAFLKSAGFQKTGAADDSGFFDEVILLDLEASLRRAQRELPAALELLGRALAADHAGTRTARILIKRAKTLEEMDDSEGAISTLRRALPHVDGERDPRLLWNVRFNLLVALCDAGRHLEAEQALRSVQELAERLGNALDLTRHVWLQARIDAGLGRPDQAEAGFQEVRRAFLDRKIAYDAALVSLDLAVLLLEQGRTAEVEEIAAELLPVFQAQKVNREALATVQLFCDAARRETLTAEMARQYLKDLRRAG